MLVNADVRGLEVVGAAELSGDKVLSQELIDKIDIHEANRDKFGLGEGKAGRLVAKIFKFRLIYGGSAFSYAHDPDFTGVSTSEKFWQGVIDEYYTKYKGIYVWHQGLLQTVRETGRIEIPSGRFFPFKQEDKGWGPKWPITTIKNYPVQGFGADLVKLARLEFDRLFRESDLEGEFICTIHDSLIVDTPSKNVDAVAQMLKQSIEAVPSLCKKVWDYDFKLPLTCEVQAGPNKKELKDLIV